MKIPEIPQELNGVVNQDTWAKIAASTKVGHRTAVFEYPEVIRDFITQNIFTFDELLEFSWQHLQVLCINALEVIELSSKGLSSKDFQIFDASQLIEILHHIESFLFIKNSDITLHELARFSGYQLKLVLEHPKAISSILKKFETVDDLLKLRWNWVEEMLIRPEQTLLLLEKGVKWEQLVNLPDWDFGWFLNHVPEILELLKLGIEFEIIGNIDSNHLRKAEAFKPLFDIGVKKDDLNQLDYWQMFMILSHRKSFLKLIGKRVATELLFKIDSYNLEKILENTDFFLTLRERDSHVFHEAATLKHTKTALLLKYSKEFLELSQHGVSLRDASPLSDQQFEDVLKHQNRYYSMIQIAKRLEIPYTSIFEIDIETMESLMVFPLQVEKLLESGLTLIDLTRYPLILSEVLKHADRILKLAKLGIEPKDLFKLSKDQSVYAFSRFPLLEILPALELTISDLEPFLLEEFKVVLSNLKSLSILKKGGVKIRELAEIHLPHLQILLDRPEYVLSLVQQGAPIYRFGHIEANHLEHLLVDPLSEKAQKLIRNLLS